MLLQEWESGDILLTSTTELRAELSRADFKTSVNTCGFEELCFCGPYVCKLPSAWRPSSNSLEMAVVPGRRRLEDWGSLPVAANRRLAGTVPANLRATIDVIFGLEVDADSPILGEKDLDKSWRFLVTHEARQPWAQRNMLKFCTTIPKEMYVMERRCWIEDFRKHVVEQLGTRFPVPATKFDSLVTKFAQRGFTGQMTTKDFLWMRGGEVKASYMSFEIDFSEDAPTYISLGQKDRWDMYVDEFNREAHRYARGAWHTAGLWVRAEAQAELISSTALMLAIVIMLAFLGMLGFTLDVLLSLYVVVATMAVVSGLAWFITVLMGWAIGPIEIIALIVFIGYAVTYSLHIAHKYGCEEAIAQHDWHEQSGQGQDIPLGGPDGDYTSSMRYARVRYAMMSIGGAAVGSAITTAGCAVFLLFCTLTIFQRLGAVVLAVTCLSIFVATVPLQAGLLMMGPSSPGWRRCLRPQEILAFFETAQASALAYNTTARRDPLPEPPPPPVRRPPQQSAQESATEDVSATTVQHSGSASSSSSWQARRLGRGAD
jgi:hypothetical protein